MAGLKRWINPGVWLLLAASLAMAAYFAASLWRIHSMNALIRDGGIEKLSPLPADPLARYAAGWQAEHAQRHLEAISLYTDAQATTDPVQAAQAWFALGNVYFKIGIVESRNYEAAVSAPTWENAQFDLARDAYRSALRIQPDLAGARYNLELLERLSPLRHLAGWRRNTDPIMLHVDKHNGWTSMQDDRKRGLP
ncbi:MAG TPA: tetratricopeptide repeat protein [Rudaea sp.]|nr:tetratricopeptide repeat protein [Rudaea sp.]